MKIKKNIAVSETGFVFNPTSGDSFTLNATGQEILQMLKEGKKREEIQVYIMGKYEVDQPTFEKSYYDFLGSLRQFNLIEENGED